MIESFVVEWLGDLGSDITGSLVGRSVEAEIREDRLVDRFPRRKAIVVTQR